MGSLKSEVYLSNPAVAAATRRAGEIIHPEKL
jgi:homoaconitase/3-isopropylmalate dehydratase large subunit